MNQGIIVHFHRITLHLHFLPVAPGGRWHYYYIFCYISYIIGLEAGFIGWVYSRFPASDESMEWVSVFPPCNPSSVSPGVTSVPAVIKIDYNILTEKRSAEGCEADRLGVDGMG